MDIFAIQYLSLLKNQMHWNVWIYGHHRLFLVFLLCFLLSSCHLRLSRLSSITSSLVIDLHCLSLESRLLYDVSLSLRLSVLEFFHIWHLVIGLDHLLKHLLILNILILFLKECGQIRGFHFFGLILLNFVALDKDALKFEELLA